MFMANLIASPNKYWLNVWHYKYDSEYLTKIAMYFLNRIDKGYNQILEITRYFKDDELNGILVLHSDGTEVMESRFEVSKAQKMTHSGWLTNLTFQ